MFKSGIERVRYAHILLYDSYLYIFLPYIFVLAYFKLLGKFRSIFIHFSVNFRSRFEIWFLNFVRDFPKIFRNSEIRPFRPGAVNFVKRNPKPWLLQTMKGTWNGTSNRPST